MKKIVKESRQQMDTSSPSRTVSEFKPAYTDSTRGTKFLFLRSFYNEFLC